MKEVKSIKFYKGEVSPESLVLAVSGGTYNHPIYWDMAGFDTLVDRIVHNGQVYLLTDGTYNIVAYEELI